MGLLTVISVPITRFAASSSTITVVFAAFAAFIVLAIVLNVLNQLLFQNPHEPPVVFHWVPVIGSTISYGMEPYKFFFECREKYGDVFTFILLGKKTTVCLGTKGNDFILNAKHKDVNAEDIYGPFTAPVFGKGVVYDCPNAKLMEQKKFVKYGLTTEAFETYVPLIVEETTNMLSKSKWFQGDKGILDVPTAMAELTIYTASRTLQGAEVRAKFDSTFADYFHDLDMGFTPINFMLPWAPLPQNRKRDAANKKMTDTYLEIIKERRKGLGQDSRDMIWNLMQCVYKNGTPIPDEEIAHMMIALLMAGQHSSSSTSSWILLRLAQNPEIMEELLAEQKRVLGGDLPPLTYENVQKLTLNAQVVKETLRIHAPIHSILRQVTNPLPIEGTNFVVPAGQVVLAAPGVTSKLEEYFPSPDTWDPHRWDADATRTGNGDEEKEEEKVDYGYGMVSKGGNSPYLPFGAGRHRCIGEQFAYLQLGTIIATMVREVKLRNLKEGDKSITNTDFSSLFSQPMRPATVRWERRGKKEL